MTDTDKNKAEKVKKEEAQTETPKTEKKAEKTKEVKVSAKLKKVIDEIENLSVIELADLVNALQKKFGVSASVPMIAAAVPANGASASASADEEQSSFNVVLTDAGANRISVIKTVKGLVPELGLKEAKDLVESAPKEVLNDVSKEKANEAKKKLEEAGAKVELK